MNKRSIISPLLCAALIIGCINPCISAKAAVQPNYIDFITNTVAPEIGYANTDDLFYKVDSKEYSDKSMNEGFDNSECTWSDRTGILGYDITDMNGDGINDMLLYLFMEDKENFPRNPLCVYFYYGDSKGNICDGAAYYLGMDYWTDPTCYYQCTGGIVEGKNGKALIVENYFMPNHANIDYDLYTCVFSCDSSGDLVLSNTIENRVYSNVEVYTKEDGNNYSSYTKDAGWDNMEMTAFRDALVSMGYPKTTKLSTDIAKDLGTAPMSYSCTYFNTPYEKRSFYNITDIYGGYEAVSSSGVITMRNKSGMFTNEEGSSGKQGDGDVDGDGMTTSSDALAILRQSVGMDSMNSSAITVADINGDGIIDSSDALVVLRISIGM